MINKPGWASDANLYELLGFLKNKLESLGNVEKKSQKCDIIFLASTRYFLQFQCYRK